ncbi:MAG TPA: DUF2752 domain-containing protein [Bacteroidetes bacterium]|nr:DUF2752 domain-containing protein [Bacteroidota bacterium]
MNSGKSGPVPEKDNVPKPAAFVPSKILYLFWAVLLLGFLVFPFLTKAGDTGILKCRFHELTGLSCPTCGMSRSLNAFVHFHFADAFRLHLLGPVIYTFAVILFIEITVKIISGISLIDCVLKHYKALVIKNVFLILGTIWILYWLVRMGMELIR